MDDDATGVPGQVLGPRAEQMTYADRDTYNAEMMAFWTWVAEFVETISGDYDDLPAAFREDGAEALAANTRH